jgi:hypothetical protein
MTRARTAAAAFWMSFAAIAVLSAAAVLSASSFEVVIAFFFATGLWGSYYKGRSDYRREMRRALAKRG